MKSYNRPQVLTGIRNILRIEGEYSAPVEEVVGVDLPIISGLDVTPYFRLGIPVAVFPGVNAVAAENGYIVAQPGGGVILQIMEATVSNETGASLTVLLAQLTAAQIATAGLANPVNFRDLGSGEIGNAATRPSTAIIGTHTAVLTSGTVDRATIPAGESHTFNLADIGGVSLYNDDPNGIPGLALITVQQNVAFNAGFKGREWPLLR